MENAKIIYENGDVDQTARKSDCLAASQSVE